MNKMQNIARSEKFGAHDVPDPIDAPYESSELKDKAKRVASRLSDTDRDEHGGVATVDIDAVMHVDEDFGKKVVYGGWSRVKAMFWLYHILTTSPYSFADVNLVNAPVSKQTTIGAIRANEVRSGDLVTVKGEVISASDNSKADVDGHFRCKQCGFERESVHQDILRDKLTEPGRCEGCESTDWFHYGRGDTIATQTLLVEESENTDSVELSDILVRVHGGLVGMVESGEHVEITGLVYDEYENHDDIHSKARFYALGFERVAGDLDLDVDDEEADEIRKEVEQDGFYEKLVASFAPNLIDLDAQKRGLIATTLTGGDIPVRDDSIRGDSHTLFVGDPGNGKSAAIKWLNKVIPRGDLASADNSSTKGLTATAVKDERIPQEYTLRAGHIVRCNGGVALIDELDKNDNGDLNELHTPMEDGVVRRAVGGQKRSMAAKCRIVAAANPVDNEFNDWDTIADQFDFPGSILSRFDLIYAFESKSMADVGEDLADNLADGIIDAQTEADGSGEDVELDSDLFDKEWFTKFIHLAWQITPIFSREATETIKRGWMETIDENGDVAAREYEALFRLSRGMARMRLSETVEAIDAERAIEVWKESLDTYAFADGEYDLSIKNDGLPESETSLKMDLKQAIEEREDDDHRGRGAYVHDVVDALEVEYENERIWSRLNRMRESGLVYRPDDDDYYRVSGGSR
ncbi:hypothetical protein AUR64_17285 [Haloprofundus marisrubri]|uniref:MCM C-terminal AAA(+) ATPase domain-containing protein n=2 Tax=Haloprofundus marisrubri TaxID=1514971 RepID=A0A0W1R8E9_9EURY|nr:hypothetical protein AUR64_17285 [Haloprofundus marisrubri]